MTRAVLWWRVYAVVALALALLGIGHWLWTLTLRGPVMYGEGAVAHAALLARYGLEYTAGGRLGDAAAPAPIFTDANYPPLYFRLASFGDPFVLGRIESIAATLFVASAIAWRARQAGRFVAATLALAWLGSVPVLQWGAAVKPDLVAMALTVAAVVALDRTRPRHTLAGAFIGAAAMAKPTALLVAIALLVFVAVVRRRPLAGARAIGGGLVSALVIAELTHGPDKAVRLHVIEWNALPWRPDLLAPLVLVALVVLAVPIVTLLVTRPGTTVVTAYVVGAAGILLLGGREGATINYLLDLSAAIALTVAGRAPRLAASVAYPIASIVVSAVVLVWLDPFGAVPGRPPGPGAWGDPARASVVASIPGTLLVEDSGLLLANGREPLVDDIFLWSRNREREVTAGFSFREGDLLLDAVRGGRFDAVVSEVDLARVGRIGGYEAQRWHPDLVSAVLARYERSARRTYGLCPPQRTCQELYVYVRR